MQIRFVLRLFLVITDLGLVWMALYALKQRRLPWFDVAAWVLLSIVLPILGPFLCISMHPIRSKQKRKETKQRFG